jgi:CheY-like chemotaxis protein
MSDYPNLSKISVLYVEDDPATQMIFYKILKRFIKNLYKASDGEEGLKKFEELNLSLIHI